MGPRSGVPRSLDGVGVGRVYLRGRSLAVMAALVLLGIVALYPLALFTSAAPLLAVATFADIEPARASADELERGLNRRLARWTYTVAMLPPDLQRYCVAGPADTVECRLVTGAALLRERGVDLTFTEDAQGFLAQAMVRPFTHWRLYARE